MDLEIKEFAYFNKAGGTNLSQGQHHPHFSGKAIVNLVTGFWDSETGWRFHGQAISEELKTFISEHGNPNDQRVFFSEFDLVDQNKRELVAEEVIRREREEFNSYMQRLKDGIEAQPDKTAAKFEGSCAVVCQGGVFYCAISSSGQPEYDNLVEPDISAWEASWKEELDKWFATPEFISYTEDDWNKILSNFIY